MKLVIAMVSMLLVVGCSSTTQITPPTETPDINIVKTFECESNPVHEPMWVDRARMNGSTVGKGVVGYDVINPAVDYKYHAKTLAMQNIAEQISTSVNSTTIRRATSNNNNVNRMSNTRTAVSSNVRLHGARIDYTHFNQCVWAWVVVSQHNLKVTLANIKHDEEVEEAAWQRIQYSKRSRDYKKHLSVFPGGKYAAVCEERSEAISSNNLGKLAFGLAFMVVGGALGL